MSSILVKIIENCYWIFIIWIAGSCFFKKNYESCLFLHSFFHF
nr:MAG TPA: hypothetical protein [Caudoviricetes sp.]